MQKIALSSPDATPGAAIRPPHAVVVMGVSGCGKSTVGDMLARRQHWAFVEGDAFHSAENHAKMRAGVPLTDEDRASWLAALGQELARRAADGVVLSCSALKRAYRQQLRAHVPGLVFIWLEVGRDAAHQRVAGRGDRHFFPTTLIDSQFATLEPPHDEAGLLHLDSERPLEELLAHAAAWLQRNPHAHP
ncbi:gluconokinase [Castellaniella hirudinis]|uniref:Gluconokinase n=1 Tax=Castellaniella hirudinis TaxID=1144617 RepID=A0ABV8S2S3_9BURK